MKAKLDKHGIPFIPKGYKKVTKGKIKKGDLFTGVSGIWSETSQAGDLIFIHSNLTYIRKIKK
jgi:hypothetical protein